MDDSKKFSSIVCANAFSYLLGILVGRGIMAGVKNTPASIIPRAAILVAVEASVYASHKYEEWCYEVGDAVASKARKAWSKFK